MKKNKDVDVFFALLRAGLWEQSVRLLPFDPIDFDAIFKLADEQSVVGLIAAGLEHVEDRKITKSEALPFLKKVFIIEQRNQAMNAFLGELVFMIREAGIRTLLVKGQGIAQCYERPLWRSSGDVDFLVAQVSYDNGVHLLQELSDSSEGGAIEKKHYSFNIKGWDVELHGTLRTGLCRRIDKGIDRIQDYIFNNNTVRKWNNEGTEMLLPAANEDCVLVFCHILQHFFQGGIGLRQICDWVRLLYNHSDQIDLSLLKSRLEDMGIMTEWKVFGCFVVKFLGAPKHCIPLFDDHYAEKAKKVCSYILKKGNFGKNDDKRYMAYYPSLRRKLLTFRRRAIDSWRLFQIFPYDSFFFFLRFSMNGIKRCTSILSSLTKT